MSSWRIAKRRAAEASWRRQVLRGNSTIYSPRLFPPRAWGWALNGVGTFVIVSVLDIIVRVSNGATWIGHALAKLWR